MATTIDQNMTFSPIKLHTSISIPFPKSSSSSVENEYFVYHQADLFPQSFASIEGIRRMGKLCDVTLKVRKPVPLWTFSCQSCAKSTGRFFFFYSGGKHVVQCPPHSVGRHRTVFQRDVHTQYDRKHPERYRDAWDRSRVSK